MTLSRDQFNLEIKEFQLKYSSKWTLLAKSDIFLKEPQLYLKTTIHESNLLMDAYITYSDSYQVPILYFLPMIQSDEFSQFASLDTLKQLLTADPGSIALAENPINGLVMYTVHPCLTSEFMSEILSSVNQLNYIESWLSFCPFLPIYNNIFN